MSPLRVLAIGTGAMATALAGLLSHYECADVTVAGRWPEGLEALRQRGALVEAPSAAFRAPLRAVPIASVPPSAFDVVLVLVKATATALVAPTAWRARAPAGLVLTLQNGLGNRETLAAVGSDEDVFAGVAALGATSLGPGHVRLFPGPLTLGVAPEAAPRLEPLRRALECAGVGLSLTAELGATLWSKLAINCALNPLAALHRVTNGELLAMPQVRPRLLEAATEVGRVAAALGIDLGSDPATLALQAAERTAGNTNSMLQDILRGAPTEIEFLNGAVVSQGRRLGVPVPVNEDLLAAVRAAEARSRPAAHNA